MGLGAAAPPKSLGAMKTCTSSICRASSKLPSTRPPPSTSTLVNCRRPSSSNKRVQPRGVGRARADEHLAAGLAQPPAIGRARLAARRPPAPALRRAVRTSWLCDGSEARGVERRCGAAVRGPGGRAVNSGSSRRGRLPADDDGVHPAAQAVDDLPRCGAGDPAAGAACGWRSCRRASWPTWR